MNDEQWLRELAREAKESAVAEADRLDERWDRLSAGSLTPEEEAELRALADGSEEGAEAYELFRPFSPEVQNRLLRALDAQEGLPSSVKVATPGSTDAAEAEPARSSARVLPFPPRPWRAAAWLSGLAAAAAVLFVVLRAPSGGPFPPYQGELEGFARVERGAGPTPAEVKRYPEESRLRLILTPPTRPSGQVEADCFFVRPQGVEPCPPGLLTVREEGAVVVAGTIGDEIRLPPGDWRLCVVAGFRGRLPSPQERAALCAGAMDEALPEAGYRIVRRALRIGAA